MSDRPTASREEIRAFDRYAIERLGVPGVVLMENAGRQIADAVRAMLAGAAEPRVLALAGRGNNGGDACVAARHLAIHGVRVDLALLSRRDQVEGDAETNLAILEKMGLAISILDGPTEEILHDLTPLLEAADLVIDGLLGTGIQGKVREPYASVIRAVNAAQKPVLAIDIPSGLDCDTGRPLGPTVRAARTVTLAAWKTGYGRPESAEYVGEVVLADIGVPFVRVGEPE